MAAATGYRIVDEPRQNGLSRLAVRPLWPLLGLMLGGAWLAWPWFALNAIALGVRERLRALAWIAAGIGGSAAVAVAALMTFHVGWLPDRALPWVALGLVLWKITVGYVLFEQQSRTCELFVYFGGRVRNAVLVVAGVFFFVRGPVIGWLTSHVGDIADVVVMVLL